jgi:hypothetical protein
MITLENRVTTIPKNEKDFASYADMLSAVLNKPLSKTIDIKSMRRDLRLLDTLEESTTQINLEIDDFKYLASLIDQSEWAIKHKDILAFVDYIDSVKAENSVSV